MLDVLQILLAIFLVTVITLQAKGTGLGSSFGGGNHSYHTKRGAEKALFTATVIGSLIFVVLAFVNSLVQ